MLNISLHLNLNAQDCPVNIDFEKGNFSGWTCYTGYTDAVGTENQISLYSSNGPIYGRHTMFDASSRSTDRYGGFPVTCPNGSGHSVKLGNTTGGGEAEGISYEFTIPANRSSYTITYYYAVVFQAPHHLPNEQPRMETEIYNVTDNKKIDCASFDFIAVGSSLPGFHVSNLSDSIDVLYKSWTPVTVDLSGNAGKTIRIFFKTADCTFRRHFGYAYVDVNTECSGDLVGATYCPDDTVLNVVAPYGYLSYTWYDSSLTRVLGTNQKLSIPPPPSGTTIAVTMEPYEGYGCASTLFSRVVDSLTVYANAGADQLSCNTDTVQVGQQPRDGLVYHWTPAEGLTDNHIANPYVLPGFTNNYIVTTANSGGGCRSTDTVEVVSSVVDNRLLLSGKDAYCFGHGDSSVLHVIPTKEITWYQDDVKVGTLENKPSNKVVRSGSYYAVLTNELGCTLSTERKSILIEYDVPGITYPEKYAIENLPLPVSARPIGTKVLWSPAANLDDDESFNTEFKGIAEQVYNITITSKAGCITKDVQAIKIVKQVEIYVPTAFSPNNDGLNDYMKPIVRGVASIRFFRIYNRRGEVVYDSSNPLPGWDGYYKGSPQSPQGFVWTIQCTGWDNKVYNQKGSFVLMQ